ncbi:MAG: diaminopimelate epimerase [Gammaproteobacteria bacterium]
MKLQFAKMHGVGNDFMVMRWPSGARLPDEALVRRWADRRRGAGFDQLMLIEGDYEGPEDGAYRVFNADGSEVEQCGNGVRCVARFLAAENGAERLKLVSAGRTVEARILADGKVSVSLGEPDFSPAALPFEVGAEAPTYELRLVGREVEFGAVSLGNPHAVISTDSLDGAPVGILGAEFQEHSAFPRGVNVGFMEVHSAERIALRVFERGVGETPACGTGAAAAVAVGRHWGLLGARVDVSLPGGVLEVSWQGPGSPLWLAGPTTWVYEGQIEYESTKD